jgi:hypothetical protein
MAKAPCKPSTSDQSSAEPPPSRDLIHKLSAEERQQLKAQEARWAEYRKGIDYVLGREAGLSQRRETADRPTRQLPTTRPEGIGHKCWLVVHIVFALTREGRQWIDLDDLLSVVRERIGDQGLGKRTLNSALSYLRKGGFIDR